MLGCRWSELQLACSHVAGRKKGVTVAAATAHLPQVLWALPELRNRYVDAAAAIYGSAPQDPASDFAAQFAKVGE
jgi:hypothetical protein